MKDSFAEINVVPLVDIMLVLLVIVLMTANFMIQASVEISLPTSTSEKSIPEEAIALEINAVGLIFYKNMSIDLHELAQLFHGISRDQPVLISADKDLHLQPFITVLDEIKRLGFTHINVHTEK
jgi:biopolymer transport protein ExbD